MDEENNKMSPVARNAERRGADIHRLRSWEQEAERGYKLRSSDRLRAALHFSRAWRSANAAGLTQEKFQDKVLERLKWPHARRRTFKLANWKLLNRFETFDQELVKKYKDKSTPQKALEPYLVGVAVSAEHCRVNPDDWKLDMMRELSIWTRAFAAPEIREQDEKPVETLAVLLTQLCRTLAKKNKLDQVFDSVLSMNCHWEMFDENLVASDQNSMQPIKSPVSPVCEQGVHFEEMFPFPSFPLLRVPYLVGHADFALKPDDLARKEDHAKKNTEGYHPSVRTEDGSSGWTIENGKLVYFRELRLCVVPDGHGGICAAIESRPRVEVTFATGSPFVGTHFVHGGYEPDIRRRVNEDTWPTIRAHDDQSWRLRYANEKFWDEGSWTERDPETTGWEFDYDPILSPGSVASEPWYLSYTQATPAYLRHWLMRDWRLGDTPADCPWKQWHPERNIPDERYTQDVPPLHQLLFPDLSHATSIERCLHNGLIEEELQAAIDRLSTQAAALQADWFVAREDHAQKLLNRWHAAEKSKD